MLTLLNGRPDNETGRLKKEIKTYDFLDNLHIKFMRVDHEPAMTIDDCVKISEILKAEICKNLFLCNRNHTEFYLLMMPGDKKFKTKDLSEQLGISRLSFADEEYMQKYLDITPGSVSVMGLINDTDNIVTLLIDEEILKQPEIGCHPCINTSSIKFSTSDFVNIIIPAMKHSVKTIHLKRNDD